MLEGQSCLSFEFCIPPSGTRQMLPTISTESIRQKALALGFHKVGIAKVNQGAKAVDERNAALTRWLEQGFHADMDWMANPKRQDITQVMADVRSLICLALNYYIPHQRPADETEHDTRRYGKIARYGWGRDYHRVMQKKLKALCDWLRSHSDAVHVRLYADTGPIQDKFWAEQAGIGWMAKNGNVITREYGSWIFLGEILTNLELDPDPPHTAHCGTCTRCLEACPTQAIVAPHVVDANRCIAYHTIENRSEKLPPDIAQHLEGWVAGCDICQDVCPWNQRFAQPTDVPDFEPYPHAVAPTLEDLETLDDIEWDRRFPASALRRIKPAMWRRNARAAKEVGGVEGKNIDALGNGS